MEKNIMQLFRTTKKHNVYYGKETYYVTNRKYIVEVISNGHDIYGNPLYAILPINFKMVKSSIVYKNQWARDCYLVQTYNVLDDIQKLFKDLNENYNFETLENNQLSDELLKENRYTESLAFYGN